MELQGFIEEERLNQMFLSKEITELEYVKHHSKDMLDAYTSFLSEKDLPESNATAALFMDEDNISYGEEEEEEEKEEQQENGMDGDSMSVAVYRKWVEEKKKVNILLEGCEEANLVTLWRYRHPTEDKEACAGQLLLSQEDVEKWWDTIDFIRGSLGGAHLSLLSPTLSNIKEVIADAATQACME